MFAACEAGAVWDASLKQQRPSDDSVRSLQSRTECFGSGEELPLRQPKRTQWGVYSKSVAEESTAVFSQQSELHCLGLRYRNT